MVLIDNGFSECLVGRNALRRVFGGRRGVLEEAKEELKESRKNTE